MKNYKLLLLPNASSHQKEDIWLSKISKLLKHRVKTASTILLCSCEPEKCWHFLLLKFDYFWQFLAHFLHDLTVLTIFVILSPYLIIFEILQFSAIFAHLLAIFCPFWGICIWMHFKASKPIVSCFSHCINFSQF